MTAVIEVPAPEAPKAPAGDAAAPEYLPAPLGARILGAIGAGLLHLLHVSWRCEDADLARLDAHLATRERFMVLFWHGKFLPLFSLLAGRHACIFASLSFRGHVIAEISRRFGYDCVLLRHRGGAGSRNLMKKALGVRTSGALAIDGPLGPYHVVKPGTVELAAQLGMAVLPVSTASVRPFRSKKRWDRMEVPKPFSRVALALGEPIRPPAAASADDLAAMRREVREALEALDARAEAMLGITPCAPAAS